MLSQYRDGARINRDLVVCDHLTPSNSGNTFPQVTTTMWSKWCRATSSQTRRSFTTAHDV